MYPGYCTPIMWPMSPHMRPHILLKFFSFCASSGTVSCVHRHYFFFVPIGRFAFCRARMSSSSVIFMASSNSSMCNASTWRLR